MRTSFQVRNPNSDGIFISFDREPHALDWWDENVKNAPETSYHHGAIVVQHTRETESEAETARIDFMVSTGSIAKFSAACTRLAADPEWANVEWRKFSRKAIDIARGAPEPVTVQIWPKVAKEGA